MTVEQLVRDQLGRATEDVLGGPHLESSIGAGRRRRRHRRAGFAAGAAAAVAVAAVGGGAVVAHSHQPPTPTAVQPVRAPQPAAPTIADFVAGTTTDETIEQVVADHLPTLPTADDVYPSDAGHDGPMPDADFDRATDWQAVYTISNGDGVAVLVGHPGPGYESCAAPGCTQTPVPGGVVQEQVSSSSPLTGPPTFTFLTQYVADDGTRIANLREQIRAATLEQALAARTLDHAAVVALVTDPRLTF